MAEEAQYLKDHEVEKFTASAALTSGEVIQLPSGKAGVITGLAGFASGDEAAARTEGVFRLQKTASVVVLKGGQVFWVRSTGKCHPLKASGDFYVGMAVEDAAAAATTVDVQLNAKPTYHVQLEQDTWSEVAALGLGTTRMIGGGYKLAFDAVAEIAKADLLSDEAVAIADGPILEGRIAIYDIGDAAALDINFGLANATHATDADSITEAVFFHLDGSALSVLAESDDGTTEVAATDTTVDAVDDTYAEYWIDARNSADIQLYINAVNVLPATVFKLDAGTGPMKALVHIEKTSDDTTADVRVDFLRIRSTDLGAGD